MQAGALNYLLYPCHNAFLHRIIIAAHLRATGYPAEAVVCRPSGGGFRNRYRDRMLVDVHVVNEVARRRIG